MRREQGSAPSPPWAVHTQASQELNRAVTQSPTSPFSPLWLPRGTTADADLALTSRPPQAPAGLGQKTTSLGSQSQEGTPGRGRGDRQLVTPQPESQSPQRRVWALDKSPRASQEAVLEHLFPRELHGPLGPTCTSRSSTSRTGALTQRQTRAQQRQTCMPALVPHRPSAGQGGL